MTPPLIAVAPVTFGLGPASHACAIANEIRRQSGDSVRTVGVGDGAARAYMADSGSFGVVTEAAPGELPSGLQAEITIAVTDFDRAIAARQLGHQLVVVDPLYWMWDAHPMDPALADAYLCLEFPGVAERINALPPESRASIDIIPQIVEGEMPQAPAHRSGVLVNFGGIVAPHGSNVEYVRSVIGVVGDSLREVDFGPDRLVTCSRAVADEIRPAADAAGFAVAELSPREMLVAIASKAVMCTVPGLSIIWEAILLRTPTLLLPGLNYSQHNQVRAFQRFVAGTPCFSWDSLEGYGLLPPGMPESDGVARAVGLGRRFADDSAARDAMRAWAVEHLSGRVSYPRLTHDAPWTSFDGASHVARHALDLLSRRQLGPRPDLDGNHGAHIRGSRG